MSSAQGKMQDTISVVLDEGGSFQIPPNDQLRLTYELLEGMGASLSLTEPDTLTRQVVFIKLAGADTLTRDSLLVAGYSERTTTPGIYEFRIDNHSDEIVSGKLIVGTMDSNGGITHGQYSFSKVVRIQGDDDATATIDVREGDNVSANVYSLKKLRKKATIEMRLNDDLQSSFTKRHPDVGKAEKGLEQDPTKELEGFGFLGFRKSNKKKVMSFETSVNKSGVLGLQANKLSSFPIDIEVNVTRTVAPTYLVDNFQPIVIPPPPPEVRQLIYFFDQQMVLAPAEDFVHPSIRRIDLPLLDLELDTLINDATAVLLLEFVCPQPLTPQDTTYLQEVTVLEGAPGSMQERLAEFRGDLSGCDKIVAAIFPGDETEIVSQKPWYTWRPLRILSTPGMANWQHLYLRNQELISQKTVRIRGFILSDVSP